MNFKLFSLLVGSLALICDCNASPQGEGYGRGGHSGQGSSGGGSGEDLASSLGVDREALYEEMIRMQEEMGSADGQGPPPEIPESPEGPEGAEGAEGPEGQREEGGHEGGEGEGQGERESQGEVGYGGQDSPSDSIINQPGHGGLAEY